MRFSYTKGMSEPGNGCFAWLQPGGGDPLSPLELFGRMAELARR